MNFGQNLYNWFLSNAQFLTLLIVMVVGLYLGFKREFSELIGLPIVSLVVVGLAFNAEGAEDILPELFNKVIGAQKKAHHTFVMGQVLIASWWESARGLGNVAPQTT